MVSSGRVFYFLLAFNRPSTSTTGVLPPLPPAHRLTPRARAAPPMPTARMPGAVEAPLEPLLHDLARIPATQRAALPSVTAASNCV